MGAECVLGLDVAAGKADYCLMSGSDVLLEGGLALLDLEGFLVSQHAKGRRVVALACEYTGGIGGPWLLEAGRLGLGAFILHTVDRVAYKRMCQQSTKTDKADAKTIARVFSMWRSPELRSLGFMASHLFQPYELVAAAWELRELTGDVRRSTKNRVAAAARANSAALSGSVRRASRWSETEEYHKEEEVTFSSLALEYAKERYGREMELLLSVPGVGEKSACMILGSLMPLERFNEPGARASLMVRRVSRYVGMIPKFEASGGKTLKNEKYHGGHRHFRSMLTMCGRGAANPANKTALGHYFRSLVARGVPPRKAVYLCGKKVLHWSLGVLRRGELFNDPFRPRVEKVVKVVPDHLIGAAAAAELCGVGRTTLIMRTKAKSEAKRLSSVEHEGAIYFLREEIEALKK